MDFPFEVMSRSPDTGIKQEALYLGQAGVCDTFREDVRGVRGTGSALSTSDESERNLEQ